MTFHCYKLQSRVTSLLVRKMSQGVEALEKFPVWALQPRAETGATSFLNKYPNYDGRGTVIAIFDSGIDPGAGGLQITTDGKPKIIERLDASGAGDVDMTKEVEVIDGTITGITGRKMRMPSEWTKSNINEKFRVGTKRVFSLYPKVLRDRMQKERLEKIWDPGHKKNLAKITNAIEQFESSKSGETVTGKDKLIKDNLDAELDLLMQMDKKMRASNGQNCNVSGIDTDIGPTFDILSYFDGEIWRVIIDNTPDGNLENALVLRPFSVYQDYGTLTKEDCLNVSVNIHNNGEIVEIVGLCSSHGTHVASIAAANFPETPDKNGLAPGAQLISVTIGDGRLSSMETGTALIRAMTHVMQRIERGQAVDLINMSYGEHSHWSSAGKIGEMIGEIVNKYGVVWAVSAGNAGPALSTVGTPPDIQTNTMIGVGAYVSPEMMTSMYSTREKLPEDAYTWTSRGPTMDGDRGVAICAPGGAITSVPIFTNRGTQLMNGTSMACPHTAGALALLLSGLKQRGISYSPFFVKRSITATAKKLNHVCHYGQGNGLLQIEKAFEHMVQFKDSPDKLVRYAVVCNGHSKGIHLRDNYEDKSYEVPIKVEPIFIDPDSRSNEEKVNFNQRIAFGCSSAWVKYPKHVDVMYTARHFLIQIDPVGLEPGVHSAYVYGFDANEPDKGPVFEIPITVVRPEPLIMEPRPHIEHKNVGFIPGDIKRHFIKTPMDATWAVVRVRSEEKNVTAKFLFHAVSLVPKQSVTTINHQKMFSLSENDEWTQAINVKEGQVLEICLAKWWNNLGSVKISYTVTFYGLKPSCNEIVLHASDCIHRLDIRSSLHSEEITPEAKLKTMTQSYRPNEYKIVALPARDTIPKDRVVFELQLTYNFSVNKAGEITPNFPHLSDVLYESEFISQLWMLYNSHKQLVGAGDAYASKWPTKTEKDDHVLKAFIRHERRDLLEKLQDLPMTISFKLSSPISLDSYSSFSQASIFGKKASSINVAKGSTVPIYLSAPNVNDKYTKHAVLGQYLSGTITFAKDDLGKKADIYPLKFVLNEAPKKDKNKNGGNNNNNKKNDSNNGFKESMAEAKCAWVAKMDPNTEEAIALYDSLLEEGAVNQAAVRLARISAFNIDKKLEIDDNQTKSAPTVITLANEILDIIKEDDILLLVGTKYDARQDASDIKKDVEKNKGILIEALAKKGCALRILGQLDDATEVLFKLLKFTEVTDSKVILFAIYHAISLGHFARAVKLILHHMESKPNSPELEGHLSKLFLDLGWGHCHTLAMESYPARYPGDYELH